MANKISPAFAAQLAELTRIAEANVQRLFVFSPGGVVIGMRLDEPKPPRDAAA